LLGAGVAPRLGVSAVWVVVFVGAGLGVAETGSGADRRAVRSDRSAAEALDAGEHR